MAPHERHAAPLVTVTADDVARLCEFLYRRTGMLFDGNKRYYGTELDLGIRGRIDIRNFWLMAGLQGGLLLPGAGMANRAGGTDKAIGALWLRTEIRY